jgi:uncharacterized membrane protein
MTNHQFQHAVETISKVIDAVGVGVIVLGLIAAVVSFVRLLRSPPSRPGAYRSFRQQVGKAILLGLEFLVAADIIRTVAVDPTFRSVGVLAIIVAVRTFLSFTLDVELDGRWPWQPRPAGVEAGGRPDAGGAQEPRRP